MALLQFALVVFLAFDMTEQRQVVPRTGFTMEVQMGDDHALAQRQAAVPVTVLARMFEGIRRQQFAQALRRRQGAFVAAQQALCGRVGQGHLSIFGEQQQAFAQALKQGLQHRLRRKGGGNQNVGGGHGDSRRSNRRPIYALVRRPTAALGRSADRRPVRRRRVAAAR
ncbi:hypothetical protein D3C81_423340 [compost metagenome]